MNKITRIELRKFLANNFRSDENNRLPTNNILNFLKKENNNIYNELPDKKQTKLIIIGQQVKAVFGDTVQERTKENTVIYKLKEIDTDDNTSYNFKNIESNNCIPRHKEFIGYNDWRNHILLKDNYRCVCCGLDKHLHVHHLFGYTENPELAIDENNGVTLCKFCHERYHSIYGRTNINPRDFIEYMSKYGV